MAIVKSLILARIPRVAGCSKYPEAAARACTEPVLAEIARKVRLGWCNRDSINDLWHSIGEVLTEYFDDTPRPNGTTIRPCIARDVVAGFDFAATPAAKAAFYDPGWDLDFYVSVYEDGSLTIRSTEPGKPDAEHYVYPVAPEEQPDLSFLTDEFANAIRELRRPYQR